VNTAFPETGPGAGSTAVTDGATDPASAGSSRVDIFAQQASAAANTAPDRVQVISPPL